MNEHRAVVKATQDWVDNVVIGYNFCPFARAVRDPGRIRYTVADSENAGDIVEQLYSECRFLDDNDQTATTLLILSRGLTDFDDYLDTLALAEHFLNQWGYNGIYQLASFHPYYVFDGEVENSPSNFTNRSPFPAFHLIREADISRVMSENKDAASIYSRNIRKAETLGCSHFEAILSALRKTE